MAVTGKRNRTNFTEIFFMSRSSKVLTGFLSFLPIVLAAGLFITMIMQFRRFIEWQDSSPTSSEMFSFIRPFFIIEMLMFLISIGTLIFFVIHLGRNKKIDSTEKAI